MISVYIDNNVWDFLFERNLDLIQELPDTDFCLCMTREAEFEIPPIPAEKADLKTFVEKTIKAGVKTDYLFGFSSSSLPASEQRVGGFGSGRFADLKETEFMSQQRTSLSAKFNEKTRLYKNEADISVAARSFAGIVLSLDAKKGPLNTAYQAGGQVVFLTDFDSSGQTLREFIATKLQEQTKR